MTFSSRFLPALWLTAAFALPAQAAETLYSQPYTGGGEGGWISSTVEAKLPYDSFVLAADARIESVSWYGMGIEEAFGLPPASPEIFTIGIYASNGLGQPGTLLSTTTVGGHAGATDTGIRFLDIITVYSFQATLSTPFQATAGTTYWIGITDPTAYASWFWGTGGSATGTHLTSVAGVLQTSTDDLAFTLTGTVPEPASALLFTLGAAGLMVARKRRA